MYESTPRLTFDLHCELAGFQPQLSILVLVPQLVLLAVNLRLFDLLTALDPAKHADADLEAQAAHLAHDQEVGALPAGGQQKSRCRHVIQNIIHFAKTSQIKLILLMSK